MRLFAAELQANVLHFNIADVHSWPHDIPMDGITKAQKKLYLRGEGKPQEEGAGGEEQEDTGKKKGKKKAKAKKAEEQSLAKALKAEDGPNPGRIKQAPDDNQWSAFQDLYGGESICLCNMLHIVHGFITDLPVAAIPLQIPDNDERWDNKASGIHKALPYPWRVEYCPAYQ